MRTIDELIDIVETEMPLDIIHFKDWDYLTEEEKELLEVYANKECEEFIEDFIDSSEIYAVVRKI